MSSAPTTKFSRALYDFDAFLDVEKNLSPRTRRAYVYDLERFADYWIRRHSRNPALAQIAADDIRRYLETLRMDRNYKSTTLSRVMASLRIFFEFCVTRGLLESSPAAFLHNPKNPRKLPIFLVESEMKNLLDAPPRSEEAMAARRKDYQPLGTRDRAILATLAFTGIRLMELVGLNLRDVDLERATMRVMGKGSKERVVPLNQAAIAALQEWLAIRQPADAQEKAVFLNRFGRRLSPRGIEKLLQKHVRSAGISKEKVSPHKLRHTFATLLHIKGVDVVEIQALLGHASITSTQIYTHASSTRLKSAVEKLETL
ncbi:tyrosine recombinase XerC [Candidatus Sumerlaeota bacterium]|nr:tyrosine recombinase XerC [Candidatus Sumerlaeota bacterium]